MDAVIGPLTVYLPSCTYLLICAVRAHCGLTSVCAGDPFQQVGYAVLSVVCRTCSVQGCLIHTLDTPV